MLRLPCSDLPEAAASGIQSAEAGRSADPAATGETAMAKTRDTHKENKKKPQKSLKEKKAAKLEKRKTRED
jgi:hypothetical protein